MAMGKYFFEYFIDDKRVQGIFVDSFYQTKLQFLF